MGADPVVPGGLGLPVAAEAHGNNSFTAIRPNSLPPTTTGTSSSGP
jgi:hypothetical protein